MGPALLQSDGDYKSNNALSETDAAPNPIFLSKQKYGK